MKNRREKFAKGLHPSYAPLYKALCDLLPAHWQPYCGLRTLIEQEAIWMKGRTLPGPIVTNAKPGESAHNWGCGSDWALVDAKGAFAWPPSHDKVWDEYADAVEKLGLKWGGTFKRLVDNPHNELSITCPWSMVMNIHQVRGREAADNFIVSMMK